MNNKKNKAKVDSIDVATANAEERFSIEEAKKGLTNEGGNASADVTKKGSRTDTNGAKKEKARPAKEKRQVKSRTGNLGKSVQSPAGPENES